MKKSLVALATLAALGTAAHADVATNLSLTSNYKYRGQDQGNNKPAIQGGFDYSLGGFYVGNWNSSIGFTDSGVEMDFYGGYKGQLSNLGYDVGVLQYYYPQRNEIVDFNTTELYGALTWTLFTAKYSYTVSSDYFGLGESFGLANGVPSVKGRGTGYLDLSANFELFKGLTLNAHVGFTQLAGDLKDVGYQNYEDYKLGATYDLGSGFSLAGAFVGASERSFWGDVNKNRFIVTLTRAM
jgi:uncharacterized protein (TIGR02001 family)